MLLGFMSQVAPSAQIGLEIHFTGNNADAACEPGGSIASDGHKSKFLLAIEASGDIPIACGPEREYTLYVNRAFQSDPAFVTIELRFQF
jgi:hypothetical protein